MIRLVDGRGKEVDIEPYRKRAEITGEMQHSIRDYVRNEEIGLECFDADLFDKKRSGFYRAVDGFLIAFTYTQNLLEVPYHPSEEAVKRLEIFREMLVIPSVRDYGEHWFERCTNEIYCLEKSIRAGANQPLDENIMRRILEGEDSMFQKGDYPDLIKMLGRHRFLGLPEVDETKRPQLQKFVNEKSGKPMKGYDIVGFLCSAKRAGFELPPIDRKILDDRIAMLAENNGPISIYVSLLHHLRELLFQ